jgi:uncharacterized membrane protein YcaP (DUF421 family)
MKRYFVIITMILMFSGKNLIGQSNSNTDQGLNYTLGEVVSIFFEYLLDEKDEEIT